MSSAVMLVWCGVVSVVMMPWLAGADCTIKPVEKCDLGFPGVENLVFNGTCEDDVALKIEYLTWYSMEVKFKSEVDMEKARSIIVVNFLPGVVIPVRIGDTDVCTNITPACPIKNGTEYTVITTFSTLPSIPIVKETNAQMHWTVLESPLEEVKVGAQFPQQVFCVKLDLKLQKVPVPPPPANDTRLLFKVEN